MDDTQKIDRHGARGIVIDEHDHVLFIGRSATPERRPRWFLPGGGIDPGETMLQAVVRELYEETGLQVLPGEAVGPVARQSFMGMRDGAPYRQENHLFYVRAERFEPRVSGGDDYEQDLEFRWIAVGDFAGTEGIDRFEPLVDIVKRLLGGDIPADPVRLAPTGKPF